MPAISTALGQSRRVWTIAKKDIRIYYSKGPVVIFGIIFPVFLFLSFMIGRRLTLDSTMPGLMGMILFFSATAISSSARHRIGPTLLSVLPDGSGVAGFHLDRDPDRIPFPYPLFFPVSIRDVHAVHPHTVDLVMKPRNGLPRRVRESPARLLIERYRENDVSPYSDDYSTQICVPVDRVRWFRLSVSAARSRQRAPRPPRERDSHHCSALPTRRRPRPRTEALDLGSSLSAVWVCPAF